MTEHDTLLSSYRRWRATTVGRITERVESDAVFDLFGPLHGKHLLDVGTGDGTYAIEAAARGAVVTGLDRHRDMLDAAQSRASARGTSVTLVQGSAQQLPFRDGSFDLVVAVTLLCFLPNPEMGVREMARLLAPGGRIVLGELARFNVWATKRRLQGWLGATPWKHVRFWTRGDLEELARTAGLRPADFRPCVYFPPSNLLARLGAPFEPCLSRVHAPGAAFFALAADNPQLDCGALGTDKASATTQPR